MLGRGIQSAGSKPAHEHTLPSLSAGAAPPSYERGSSLPHPILTWIYCYLMFYQPLPPSWMGHGTVLSTAPLGMQEHNVGHCCLSFPCIWSSEAGQADSGLFVQGPLVWVSRMSTREGMCWQPHTTRGLAIVASVAVVKRGTRRPLGLWARLLRLKLQLSSSFTFCCE